MMALLFYIPLVFVLMCVSLQTEITSFSWLKWLDPIISFCAKFRVILDWLVLILAIAILCLYRILDFCSYQIPSDQHCCSSCFCSFASGFSAGCAATKVLAAWLFVADRHGKIFMSFTLLNGRLWRSKQCAC